MKPGYKTTEFWLSTAATVVGLLLASGVVSVGDDTMLGRVVGGVVAVLAALGYTASRAKVKAAE